MTNEVFKTEMRKLADIWPQAMTKGRIEVVWDIVKSEPDEFILSFARKWVIENTRAPLPSDFSIAVKLRERSRELDIKWADSPHPCENSIFSKEEITEMFQFMKDAAKGKYTTEEVNNYCEMIEKACLAKGVSVSPWRD